MKIENMRISDCYIKMTWPHGATDIALDLETVGKMLDCKLEYVPILDEKEVAK